MIYNIEKPLKSIKAIYKQIAVSFVITVNNNNIFMIVLSFLSIC